MKKAQTEGTLTLIDEGNNNRVVASFDLASDFGILQNVRPFAHNEIDVVNTDGDKPLPVGDAAAAVGMIITVTGGSVNFKHDGNPNSSRIDRGLMLYGNMTAPIVSTASVTPVTVKYLFFK